MFPGVFPSALYTTHKGQGTSGKSLSPRLWARLVQSMQTPDHCDGGFGVFEDFLQFAGFSPASGGTSALPSVTVPGVDGFTFYGDQATTATTFSRLADVSGGVARLATGATDNHLCAVGTKDLGAISDTAGDEKLTIFEARVRLPSQVSSGSVFVGLASPGAIASGGLIDNTGGLKADQAGIGFRTLDADPDGLDFVYQAASQTEQVVHDEAKVITADTYVRLGFIYDPSPMAGSSKRIRAYVDNQEVATKVTATNIAAATFPDADYLGIYLAAKGDGGTARLLDVDWVAFYQER